MGCYDCVTDPTSDLNCGYLNLTLVSLCLSVLFNTAVADEKQKIEYFGTAEKNIDSYANYGIEEYSIDDAGRYIPRAIVPSVKRVLSLADAMTNISPYDGLSYKQHNWSKNTDLENLAEGIDCSRAIWFIFTRAGLPYTKNNKYLTTKLMADNSSEMNQYFELCPIKPPFRTGDILVYRDEARLQGHTVMVINSKKKIAWGSHGWDGSSPQLTSQEVGVEYQQIRGSRSWNNWDSKNMEINACWRHKIFIAESSAY